MHVAEELRIAAATSQENPQILLVEDTVELSEALSQQLEALGCSCTCALTVDAARHALGESNFSCALIDLGLPDGRGLDLVFELPDLSPLTIPIILTGDANSDSIIEAMRAGAFDYLLKPTNLATLRTSVHRALRHHEAVRDRALLVDLLKKERDHLRDRVEEATRDVRKQAERLEASNAMLHALLDLGQISSGFLTDEALAQAVFETVEKHVPVTALALADVAHKEFLGTRRDVAGNLAAMTCREGDAHGSHPCPDSESQPYILTASQQFLNVDVAGATAIVLDQEFWGRTVCAVAFFLEEDAELDPTHREFLEMCARFIGFEWQRSRLLLHGAQQAGLGNIAQELTKTFLQSLTAVSTATEVLTESVQDDDQREGLDIIAHHAAYLSQQAQAFYKLAQVRSDSVETVRLVDYIDHTLNLLSQAIRQRGVTVEKEFQDPGECILLNGGALASTFLDLISSAVRAMPEDGSLHLRLHSESDDRVLFEIAHEGDGHDLHGDQAAGFDSLADALKAHPRFMLAERTIQTCGGSLSVERNGKQHSAFRILLPRNGLNVSIG